MTCKTKEDFNSAIEFGKIINDTHPDQSAETTVQFLDNTQENVAKIEGSYQALEGTSKIKQSVTEKVGKKYTYSGKNEMLEQQGQIGNHIHELGQFLTASIYNEIKDKSTNAAISHINNLASFDIEGLKKISEKYGKQLDAQSLTNLFAGVKENLLSIYRVQRTINVLTKTEGKLQIRLEQIVIDPLENIGGTLDFVAIYSDNTAAIVDYKTKVIPKANMDIHGNILDFGKVVRQRDLEKYKMQLGEYGRILKERYGVKSIASVTVIPIKLKIAVNTKTKKYADKIEGLAFPGQDSLLQKVYPFTNKTKFKDLDDYMRGLDERIKKFEQRIRQDPKKREELQEKIFRLEQGKKDILTKHSMDSILDYAKEISDKVTQAELGNLTIPELQDLIDELELLSNLSDATYQYRQFLKGTSKAEEVEEVELKIGLITRELNDRIQELRNELFQNKITKLIELNTGYKITDDYGNYIPFQQEGYFGKWFYQLSQFENPIFQSLRKTLDEINYQVRQNTDKVVEDIVDTENKVEEWLRKSGKSYKDLVDIMINPSTDNFWGKYSKEYFDEIDRANGSTLHKYYQPSDSYEEWYQNKLMEKLQQFRDVEKLEGKDLENRINYWISQNDLTVENGTAKYPDAWENSKKFNHLQLKDNPEHYNEKYQYIRSVPELKVYYEMFEKYNKMFRKMLGVEYNRLPNNFLPNIRKVMSERITEQGFNGFISGTQDFFKDFSIREEDRSADTTYNSNSQIPIFFLNRFQSKDKQLQVGEKSYQFGRSLAIFAKMAFNYEATTAREAEILAHQQFLSQEAEQLVQSRGKNLIDQMGNTVSEKLQATDLPDIFKSFVDMYVYRINVKPILGDKSGKAEKMLLKAKEYFTLKTLGFNVIAGLGSLATAKINAMVEANKGIIFNSTNYKESMQASWSEREKFLAINAYFDPMGHRLNNPAIAGEKKYGERQYGDPTMRGWVNKYVNSRMLMNTFSIGDEYIEEMITVAMAKNYYISKEGNFKSVKSSTPKSEYEGRLIWDLFSYSKEDGVKFNVSEEQMENAFTSFRGAIQAGQSRIKGTIPEEDKAHWQSNIVGQMVMHFKSWMPGILFERFGKVKFDSRIQSVYMGKFTALGKELAIPENMILQEYVKNILLPKLGKLLLHLTTFGIFSSTKLNDVENKKMFFEKWLDQNPHYKGKVNFEEFLEVQQKQLKSVMQELRVLLVFTGLILLLGLDLDDDGERDYSKYLLTRKLASLLFKTQQELAFVYMPTQFASMIRSPLPTIGLVTDATKLITNTFGELFDLLSGKDALVGLGKEKGDKSPRLSQTVKTIPGAAGILRFIDFFNQDIQYINSSQ